MAHLVASRRTTRRVVFAALALAMVHVVRLAEPSRGAARSEAAATPSITRIDPLPCARDRVQLTAHRGTGLGTRRIGGQVYSEDTIPAFRLALAAGVEGVELDYWPTSDDRFVVHHDPTLNRMTDGRERIDAHTWAEIAHLRHPSGAGVASLGQVIGLTERFGGDRQQEIKNGAAFGDRQLRRLVLADVAGTSNAYQRLLYTSTTLGTLRRLHEIDPSLPLGFITREPDARPVLARLPRWLDVVHIDLRAADAIYVRDANEQGLEVSLRGVDNVVQLRRAAQLGAQRVVTNRPEVLGRAC